MCGNERMYWEWEEQDHQRAFEMEKQGENGVSRFLFFGSDILFNK